jgi:hypothetical protein
MRASFETSRGNLIVVGRRGENVHHVRSGSIHQFLEGASHDRKSPALRERAPPILIEIIDAYRRDPLQVPEHLKVVVRNKTGSN